MVAEAFSETFIVTKTDRECWDILVDVPRISGWVPLVGAVTEHEPLKRYTAVLEDRMGPFRLRADLDVIVTQMIEPASITIRADGEDRQVGSRITVDATLGLSSSTHGCTIDIDGSYEVTGRVATMGSAAIRQKAEAAIQAFVDSARAELT